MVSTSKRDIGEEYAVLTAQLKRAKNHALSERELDELKGFYSQLEHVGSLEKKLPEYTQAMHEFATIFEAHDLEKQIVQARQDRVNLDLLHQQLGRYLGGRVSLDQVLKDAPEISRLYVQVRDSKAYQENSKIAQKIDRRVGYIMDKFAREAKYRLAGFKETLFVNTPIRLTEFPPLPPIKGYSSSELEQREAQQWADALEQLPVPKSPEHVEPYVPRRSLHDQSTLKEDLGNDFPRMGRFLEQCVLLGTVFGETRVRNTAIEALRTINPSLKEVADREIEQSCYEEPWPNPQTLGEQASEWERRIKEQNHHVNGARPVYEAIRSVRTLVNHNPLSSNSVRMYARKTQIALKEKFRAWYHDISKYF